MMPLLLSNRTHAIYKFQRLGKVRKFIFALQMMLIYHLPLWNAFVQRFEFFSLKRRDTSAAGNALFIR